ncbi:MAG: SIS domain-containing protein [Actinomycetota bacterium]
MDLLDNEKNIRDSIPEKMIKSLYAFPGQFKAAENIMLKQKFSFNKKFKNALILGVGNSAQTAYRSIDSLQINKSNIPIILNTKPDIPSWVDKDTLVIAVSHSGDSVEVLRAVDEALDLGIGIFAITTDGKLKEKAASNKNITIIDYDIDVISRMATGYFYVFIVDILNKAGAIDICSDRKDCLLGIDWDEVESALLDFSKELAPDVKTYKNPAKRTAINFFNNIPIIYGSNRLTETVCFRLKNQICLNSKNFAHFNTMPEMDHGEIAAWGMRRELRNKFFVLFISDKDSRTATKTRIEILKGILMEKRIIFEEIMLEGPSDAVKVFNGILLADWISVYLAVLNKVDPTMTRLLDLMKTRFERVSSSSSAPDILDL